MGRAAGPAGFDGAVPRLPGEKIYFAPGTMFSATDRYRHCLHIPGRGRTVYASAA
jgi:hypothetical protein